MIRMKSMVQIQQEEDRRALLVVLCEAEDALRARTVRSIMEMYGAPTTWETFMSHVGYLAGEELLRVFPSGTRTELSPVDQAQYIALCKRASYDSAEANQMLLRIRQRGRHFMEGNAPDVKGVATS